MKPILFNTEMVKAILDGRKTVTRRLIKPRYRDDECGFQIVSNAHTGEFIRVEKISDQGCGIFSDGSERHVKPPYQSGDILYVRETWGFDTGDPSDEIGTGCFVYRADGGEAPNGKWRPSLHMPKEAARIFLRVVYVKPERLRDMVLADVLMEGIAEGESYKDTWERWHDLWDSTIDQADLSIYGWEANPWVWVIRFERCEKPQEG